MGVVVSRVSMAMVERQAREDQEATLAHRANQELADREAGEGRHLSTISKQLPYCYIEMLNFLLQMSKQEIHC